MWKLSKCFYRVASIRWILWIVLLSIPQKSICIRPSVSVLFQNKMWNKNDFVWKSDLPFFQTYNTASESQRMLMTYRRARCQSRRTSSGEVCSMNENKSIQMNIRRGRIVYRCSSRLRPVLFRSSSVATEIWSFQVCSKIMVFTYNETTQHLNSVIECIQSKYDRIA